MDNLNPPYGVPTTINNEFQTEEVQKKIQNLIKAYYCNNYAT